MKPRMNSCGRTVRSRLSPDERAFTRLELCAIVLVLFLAVLIAVPAIASSRSRMDRVICANNLRQVGASFLIWANDRGDRMPFDVSMQEGGTMMHSLAPNAWLHFSWISNELRTPKVLFCPSDTGSAALNFTGDPAAGYVHPNFANRATSYFLMHQLYRWPERVLAGDRNLVSSEQVGCSVFRTAAQANWFALSWNNQLHDGEGNLLLFDGQVIQTDVTGLRAINTPVSDTATVHFVTPR